MRCLVRAGRLHIMPNEREQCGWSNSVCFFFIHGSVLRVRMFLWGRFRLRGTIILSSPVDAQLLLLSYHMERLGRRWSNGPEITGNRKKYGVQSFYLYRTAFSTCKLEPTRASFLF